jgi:hypothetical protein
VKDDVIEIRVQRQLAAFEALGQRLMPVLRLLDVEDEVRRGDQPGVSVPPIGEAHATDVEEESVESGHESVTLGASRRRVVSRIEISALSLH